MNADESGDAAYDFARELWDGGQAKSEMELLTTIAGKTQRPEMVYQRYLWAQDRRAFGEEAAFAEPRKDNGLWSNYGPTCSAIRHLSAAANGGDKDAIVEVARLIAEFDQPNLEGGYNWNRILNTLLYDQERYGLVYSDTARKLLQEFLNSDGYEADIRGSAKYLFFKNLFCD